MQVKKYKCLVVDDEPIARQIIINYIQEMPLLELSAEKPTALTAIDYLRLNNHQIDIIFLDINMPNLSGLQLLKIIQQRQPVIFTTAYAEHAVESYEFDAADYLLKPFSFERFTKAVYRAIDAIRTDAGKEQKNFTEQKPMTFIKSDGKNYPVYLDDILFCEARKNYTMVVLKNEQKLMPLVPLSKLESALKEAGGEFLQVHRSFVIARNQISAITANHVLIGKFEIPIGVQFREKFFQVIGMNPGS